MRKNLCFVAVLGIAVAMTLCAGFLKAEIARKDQVIRTLVTETEVINVLYFDLYFEEADARRFDAKEHEIEVTGLQALISFMQQNLLPFVMSGDYPISVDQCFRFGGWDYIVVTYNPGTKNAGSNTILMNNSGSEVLPDDLKDLTATVETPWGVMQWCGSPHDRPSVRENSGWFPVIEKTICF